MGEYSLYMSSVTPLRNVWSTSRTRQCLGGGEGAVDCCASVEVVGVLVVSAAAADDEMDDIVAYVGGWVCNGVVKCVWKEGQVDLSQVKSE